MADKINVWIKIDTIHKICFNLSKDTTIKDLKSKIYDKEGQEVDVLMYRTKPLRNKDNSQQNDLTLRDYNVANNATFFASLRFLGGAQLPDEGCNAIHFIENTVRKLGAEVVTDNCKGGGGASMAGCKESNVKKAKLKCGCIFCGDCLRMTLDSLLTNGTLSYQCGYSNCGAVKGAIDINLAYAICNYNDEEMAKHDLNLDENALKSPFSMMRHCAKQKCNRFVARKNQDIRAQCSCGAYTCWFCGGEHKSQDNPLKCGNDDCDPVATYQGMINDGCMTDVHGKQCWNKRLCPGPQCWRVNARLLNNGACNHMSCQGCGYQYCHWCMERWQGHESSECVVKGKQQITMELLLS